MKDSKLLLLLSVVVGLALPSCSKERVGYFNWLVPQTPYTQYVYFFNIAIDSNSTYSFKIPELSQAIIDSGTMQVYFKSDLVLPDNNYSPLPEYTFSDGKTVIVELLSAKEGQVVLINPGPTTPSMDYYVYLSNSR